MLVPLDLKEPWVCQEQLDHRESLEMWDQSASQVWLVHRDPTEAWVTLEWLEHLVLRVDQDSLVKWEFQVELETLEQQGTQETRDRLALLEEQGPLVNQGCLVAPGLEVTLAHLGF